MDVLFAIYRALFAKPFFRRFNYAVFRFGLTGLGVLNYKNDRASGEKYLIKTILPKKILKDRPVLFDIGANIGNYSKLLLESFPNATVYSIEPHPRNFTRLKQNIHSNNVKFYNIALGETIGNFFLYDDQKNDDSTYASLYKEVISEIHKQETVQYEVSIDTLDNIAEREGLEFIDYVKIDTEGNDLSVLKGASSLLKNGKIGYIHFEFNEMNVISRVFFRDFRALLSNYVLYRLLPNGLLPLGTDIVQTELFAYQNILAIPKKLQG